MAQDQKIDMNAIMSTPEFHKAVTEAAAKAVAASMADVTKMGGLGSVDEATKAFFSTMALQIAEISDQGTNRKRVAPEVLAHRAKAAERAHDIMDRIHKHKLKPEYKVVSKVYFNERLIEPFRRNPDKTVVAQEIIWTGMPNECLRPINDIAKELFTAYRESIGSREKIATEDHRPVWMTPGGLVVKGDPPPKMFVAAPIDFDTIAAAPADNNDPNAAEVHVLGTIAAPAKRNFADPAAAMAERVPR